MHCAISMIIVKLTNVRIEVEWTLLKRTHTMINQQKCITPSYNCISLTLIDDSHFIFVTLILNAQIDELRISVFSNV